MDRSTHSRRALDRRPGSLFDGDCARSRSPTVEQILNHQSGHRAGIAGIYNKSSYEREVKAALALWADHVRTLIEGGERKIVPMRQVP